MNISMAPITSKGRLNAVNIIPTERLFHGSNRIKPLFRRLPISRQISLRQIQHAACQIAHLRGIEVGKLAVALLILDLSQQKQPHTKGIRLWLSD